MFREHGAGLRPCLSAGAPLAPGAPHLQVLDRQEHALGTQVSQRRSSLTLKVLEEGGKKGHVSVVTSLLVKNQFFSILN